MKRVNIIKGKAALVYRNGEYNRVLRTGKHWIGFTESVVYYNTTQAFYSKTDLDVLLEDRELASMLDVFDVKRDEIVFVYRNGLLVDAHCNGRFAYWKDIAKFEFIKDDKSKIDIDPKIETAALESPSAIEFVRSFKVESFEEGLLIVDGEFVRKLKPGTYRFWKNTSTIEVLKADKRKLQFDVSGQEILSRDKAGVRINLTTTYQVTDIEKALLTNSDLERQLYVAAQLAIREYMGTLSLDEMLDKKESASEYVKKRIEEVAGEFGIEIFSAGIKDIILPGEVREIMNKVLIAEKQTQANTITRREETASTRTLLNTAKLMEENDMLFKLKEMEYVEKIADKINNISLSGGNQVIDQLRDIFSK